MSAVSQVDRRYGCSSCLAVFRTGFARCPIDGNPLQALEGDPLEGSTFADRYVIERCIGEGGMGRVYRARHQRVSRRFAVKVLFGDHATDEKMRERFSREAEAASRLSHPNVISVVDFGETAEGLSYLVMDFVEGRELSELVREEAPLPAERVRDITRKLALGLAHAHAEGLVHRDFKPENVLVAGVGGAEQPRIVDFGIAVLQEVADERLTTEGIVLGTPAYMSPEQAMGRELDERTDLYSLGVMVYEMLAGALPFQGTPLEVARQNLAADAPAIRDRVPGLEVDSALEQLALRLMAKKPEARYQSADEVIEALDQIELGQAAGGARAGGEAAPASSDTSPISVGSPGRESRTTGTVFAGSGNPRRTWMIALAALLLLAGGGGLYLATRDSRETAAAAEQSREPSVPTVAAVEPQGEQNDRALEPNAETETTDGADQPRAETVADRSKSPAVKLDRTVPEPRHKVKPGKVEPVAREAPNPPAAAEPPKITTRSLTSLYVEVGESIERVARNKGEASAAPFRRTYRQIAFQDALRKPNVRAEVDRDLRALKRDLSRALR